MSDAFYAWALFDLATGRLVLSGGFPPGMDVPREGAKWLNGMKLSPGHRLKALALVCEPWDVAPNGYILPCDVWYVRDAVQQ